MVSVQTLQGRWNEIQGKLRERWGQLTEDDVSQFQGDVDQLVGLIQRKTGESREAIEHYLDKISSQVAAGAGRVGETARQYGTQVAQGARQAYDRATERTRERYAQAEALVQRYPTESVAVAFGAGMLAGLMLGLVLRSDWS